MLVVSLTIFALLSLIAGATQGIKPDHMYWTHEINTAYERFQMERFGNILPPIGSDELENGKDKADRMSDYAEAQANIQLLDHD